MIEIKGKANIISVSNITALKPQYALLTPHLNTHPISTKEWTLKITIVATLPQKILWQLDSRLKKISKLVTTKANNPKMQLF